MGAIYELGNPAHRLGTTIGFFATKNSVQLSANYSLFYAFKNYGPQISRWEVQANANLGIAFGQKILNREAVDMLSPVSNFSARKNMLSYGLKYYWDEIETKQFTGIIALRLNEYYVATENDGFVFLPWDQYRTGAISIGKYFVSNTKKTAFTQQRISLDVLLYTGKTQGDPTERITKTSYPSRFGYKKLNDSKYHKSSHGILKCTFQTNLGAMQNASASIGVDDERIRNFIQNKIIHDLPFAPRALIKIKNPHIPMRNSEGRDYLYGENETIRRGRFVWGVGFNRPYFY